MRGGKSVWGCMEGLQLSLDYPGNRGLICRWELPSLKRTTLTSLNEFLPIGIIKHHNKKEGIIELINGSSILYMGLKPSSEHSALERLKSLELGWFFIDEATEIEKRFFDLLKTRLSLKLPSGKFPYYRGLLASNPEPGWVRDTFVDQSLDSHEFIPALPSENPHLNPDYIKETTRDLPPELAKKYLEGSWDVMLKGMYVFPYEWVKVAAEAKLKRGEPCEFGVDIAREGGDENAVACRWGNVVRVIYTSSFQKTMKTAGEIALLIEKEKPDRVRIDTVGVGAGVYDRLEELEYRVEEFKAGNKPGDPEKYFNLKAEVYWRFRKLLERGQVDLENDPKLIAQFAAVQYDVQSDKRIKIWSKDKMKSKGLRSPDRAEAVITAFFGRPQEVKEGGAMTREEMEAVFDD